MDQEVESAPKLAPASAAPATTPEVAPSPTTFNTAGPIPAVASSGTSTSTTASQLAFGDGICELEALIAAGRPDPKKVVALIDAHRSEHDAMFAMLESKLGVSYVAEVKDAMKLRASIKRKELVAGDPNDPNGGYFSASAAEKGAKWRTSNGGFTGTANENGLDTNIRLDSNDSLHGVVKKDMSGTLAWNHNGKTEAELYGNYKDGDNNGVGVRRNWAAGKGQITTSLDHTETKGVSTDAAIGSYKSGDGKTTAKAAVGADNDGFFQSGGFHTAPSPVSTVDANVKHNDKGFSGDVGGTYKLDDTKLDGKVTRGTDKTGLHLGATEQLNPAWNLTQKLDATAPDKGDPTLTGSVGATYKDGKDSYAATLARATDKSTFNFTGSQENEHGLKLGEKFDLSVPDKGKAQSTLSLSESYRHGNIVQSASLEAGLGAKDYAKVTGGIDAGFGNGFYGGAWGSYSYQDGKQNTAQLGASLTFTPQERMALTLAGLVDQDGVLEARLQYDVFSSKISNVGEPADHKKKALVSLFLSYRQNTGNRVLDDRYGAATLGTNTGNQVTAGIRIGF